MLHPSAEQADIDATGGRDTTYARLKNECRISGFRQSGAECLARLKNRSLWDEIDLAVIRQAGEIFRPDCCYKSAQDCRAIVKDDSTCRMCCLSMATLEVLYCSQSKR
jgi:hypothetical protein